MKIVYAGSPDIAVLPLEKISKNFEIVSVLTNPDSKRGRGRKISFTAVKQKALELQLDILQPRSLEEPAFLDAITGLKPDILVVVAYGKIFKKSFLDLFPLGGINMHPSLLPKYRGPSPIPAVILAGERETGVTIQKIALKVDSGDILAAKKISLNGKETTGALTMTLSALGANLLIEVLDRLAKGERWGIAQKEEEASYCRLIRKEDGLINWERSAVEIDRMVRAYDPWPHAFTYLGSSTLSILSGSVLNFSGDKIGSLSAERVPGSVIGTDNSCGILVMTGKGVYCIKRLKLQFRKATDWKSFLNGQPRLLESVLGGCE